jgi:hypothetical protein
MACRYIPRKLQQPVAVGSAEADVLVTPTAIIAPTPERR